MTITKERLLKIQHWRETYGADSNVMLPAEGAEELARIALASLTAEPVAWKYRLVDIDSGAEDHWKYSTQCITPASGKTYRIESIPLYTVSQPVPERERIRREHAEWSDATFGDVGPIGPLKHLSKEALEAAADPSDPLEWADMQFLLWDAQRRMGLSDEFITRAMIEKLEINKSRQWPEPKDGEPRLHIKEQPAPVVPDEMATSDDMNLYQKSFAQGYNACRAAMLHGDTFRENSISSTNNFREIAETSTNSPAIPDDWVMVPKEPTQAMIKAWLSEVANFRGHAAGYKAALAAAPQREVK